VSQPDRIPEQLIELIARRFRLLAEPMRLRLLDRLRDGEATVQELAGELETSQQNISKHLAMLADAGILARRRDRTRIRYGIRSIPTVAVFRDGEPVTGFIGALPATAIGRFLDEHVLAGPAEKAA
jgi:DNA-binding transcriptional ArsR family regulator